MVNYSSFFPNTLPKQARRKSKDFKLKPKPEKLERKMRKLGIVISAVKKIKSKKKYIKYRCVAHAYLALGERGAHRVDAAGRFAAGVAAMSAHGGGRVATPRRRRR